MGATVSFVHLTRLVEEIRPRLAFILGSGLGLVAERVEALASVPFADLPGVSGATVQGHRGQLTLARWRDCPVLLQEGRLHFYEGRTWAEVGRPVELLAQLGIETLVLTNAAGGIHPDLFPGAFMLLRDHRQLTSPWWWRPLDGERLLPADKLYYSTELRRRLSEVAAEMGEQIVEGTYCCLTGPCYETPAEIRAVQSWGGDAVGMSTAHEVETACRLGMQCLAISLITNRAAGLSALPLSHAEVMETAKRRGHALADLLERFLERTKEAWG